MATGEGRRHFQEELKELERDTAPLERVQTPDQGSGAFLLTDDLIAEDFAFYGRLLSGTEQIRDRWKRGVSVVESLLGDALGKLYVERHFPPRAKERMVELVDNLVEAFRRDGHVTLRGQGGVAELPGLAVAFKRRIYEVLASSFAAFAVR